MLVDKQGIPLINPMAEKKKDELYKEIAINALRAMTSGLVEMENKKTPEKKMMNKCVWPILQEAERRFSAIRDDETDVPVDGFEFMIGQ